MKRGKKSEWEKARIFFFSQSRFMHIQPFRKLWSHALWMLYIEVKCVMWILYIKLSYMLVFFFFFRFLCSMWVLFVVWFDAVCACRFDLHGWMFFSSKNEKKMYKMQSAHTNNFYFFIFMTKCTDMHPTVPIHVQTIFRIFSSRAKLTIKFSNRNWKLKYIHHIFSIHHFWLGSFGSMHVLGKQQSNERKRKRIEV